ncbi:hypothetical protein ACFYY8_25245 [Streptosporangium sp. NPDC001559]|uniref:hypothetical protein n=1 Tax=Streptosporangium sp. NPDC001559 TaxID=3366187 RepID=UPI0036E9B165
MTPSRKPSRATVITASIAIGVFGAGAGLGTVIAARSQPPAEQAVRLAAGTYHLDELAQAWKAGDAPPLSGSDAGSAISKKGPLGTVLAGAKVCLTATADGHAVSGSAGGCIGLPVLASATAPLQRPGNPKSGTTKDTKDAKDTKDTATVKPVKNDTPPKSNTGGGGGGGGGGGTTQKAPVSAPVQPPKTNTKAAPPPASPTKKVSGGISDNGSVIDKPATLAEKPKLGIGADAPKVADREEKPQPDSPNPPKAAKPTGTLKPALPNSTAKPVTPPKTAAKQKPQSPVNQPLDGPTKPRPSGKHNPYGQSAPKKYGQTLPAPDSEQAPDSGQAPDQTVLQPAPMGAEVETLPVFKDPELLKRAQEALGLDKNMRYTDENGVWDLNIAPPGTPPCRDYTEDELRELGADQDGAVIPRDSCRWPAFVRWLYAEPAPGEVSNWTKFTGLPERNLEFVVTDQAPAQSPQAPTQPEQQPDQQQPEQNDQYDPYGQDDQPGQQGQPDQQGQQGQNGEYGQQPPAQSGKHGQSGGLVPAQPQPDQQTSHSKQQRRETPSDAGPYETRRYIKNGPGQVEPDQDGHTGP